jgi:ribosomal protein S17
VNKYKKYRFARKKYLVHDEEEYCRAGDRIIIRAGHKMSSRKSFYVSRVEQQGLRMDFWDRENLEKRYLSGFLRGT